MEREPWCEDKITKIREFPSRTIRKLVSSKEVNWHGKKSYEKTVWQEKEEFTRIKY